MPTRIASFLRPCLLLILWGWVAAFAPLSQARGPFDEAGKGGTIAEVKLASLPPEARHTYNLIRSGGPFPYPKDGVVFGNREKILPRQKRGYYTEYTVKTPGERTPRRTAHRGGGRPAVIDRRLLQR